MPTKKNPISYFTSCDGSIVDVSQHNARDNSIRDFEDILF